MFWSGAAALSNVVRKLPRTVIYSYIFSTPSVGERTWLPSTYFYFYFFFILLCKTTAADAIDAAAAAVIGFGAQRIGNYRGNRRGVKLIAKNQFAPSTANPPRRPLTLHSFLYVSFLSRSRPYNSIWVIPLKSMISSTHSLRQSMIVRWICDRLKQYNVFRLREVIMVLNCTYFSRISPVLNEVAVERRSGRKQVIVEQLLIDQQRCFNKSVYKYT